MKQTDFIRQINREDRKYKIIKMKYYLQMKLSFGKKREQREFAYSIFTRDSFFDHDNNALAEPYYYKPTDIIIYDLVQKKDLQKTQKGLKKLFEKCYSHKFLWGGRSEKDIEDIIKGLDQTLHSGNSWYKTGLFDFAYNEELESYIDYFELCFHNFSSSYVATEMRIALADKYTDEISRFIKDPYKKPGMSVHRHWGRRHGKSGAKISYGVSSGTLSEYAKSQLIYEQLRYVKELFLREIVRYFPLIQYSKYKDIYGINVFETNITPNDRLDQSVYSGLGINDLHGFNLSIAERLYISTEIIDRNKYESDMMFVYNPKYISEYEMYGTVHNKVLEQLTMDYMDELYRVVILKDLGIRYQYLIGDYRNIINRCKTSRRQYKELLKIKYQLNQKFYDFKKIDEELPVNKELEKASKKLENNKYANSSIYRGFHTYSSFTGNPKYIWEQIRNNYSEVERDLNRKIEIADSLAKYSSETINRRMIYIQVLISAMTFILVIFPEKARSLANLIKWILGLLPVN